MPACTRRPPGRPPPLPPPGGPGRLWGGGTAVGLSHSRLGAKHLGEAVFLKKCHLKINSVAGASLIAPGPWGAAAGRQRLGVQVAGVFQPGWPPPPPPGMGPATEKAHQGGASLSLKTAPEAGHPRGHPGLGRWLGKRGVFLIPERVQAGPASLTAQGLRGVPRGLMPLFHLHAQGSGGPRSPPTAASALGFSVKGGRRLLPELQNLKALGFLGAALRHTPCQA